MNDISPQFNQPIPWLPPILPVAPTQNMVMASTDSFESDNESEHSAAKSNILQGGANEVRMHTAATVLMGAGTLLMNFIPGFKMSWPMAAKFAVANMVMMMMIAFGLGAYKATKGEPEHHM